MKLSLTRGAAIGALVVCGCTNRSSESSAPSPPSVQSSYTDLAGDACRQEIDSNDPNDTPYLVCPGVAGYSLIVRRAGSGRRSIDVVNAAKQVFPLRYDEVVTRHMFSLGDKAEWRVATERSSLPIALIVPVRAREDLQEPEKVSRTYLAIAKIDRNEACVIDTIPDGTRSEAEVRSTADSARQRDCAPPKPPIVAQ